MENLRLSSSKTERATLGTCSIVTRDVTKQKHRRRCATTGRHKAGVSLDKRNSSCSETSNLDEERLRIFASAAWVVCSPNKPLQVIQEGVLFRRVAQSPSMKRAKDDVLWSPLLQKWNELSFIPIVLR